MTVTSGDRSEEGHIQIFFARVGRAVLTLGLQFQSDSELAEETLPQDLLDAIASRLAEGQHRAP